MTTISTRAVRKKTPNETILFQSEPASYSCEVHMTSSYVHWSVIVLKMCLSLTLLIKEAIRHTIFRKVITNNEKALKRISCPKWRNSGTTFSLKHRGVDRLTTASRGCLSKALCHEY